MFQHAVRAQGIIPAANVCALLWLATSASAPAAQGIAAPQLVVGDHWQYRVTDNLRRGALSGLDAEVIAATGRTARIRFVRTDAGARTEWIDEVDGEGGLTSGSLNHEAVRPFNPPAQLLAFPLDRGKTWRQTIDVVRADTGLNDQILISGRVNRPATTTVPAGRFDTVYVFRTMQLDDAQFWRTRTSVRDSIWYAAAAKAPVREMRQASYVERGGGRNAPIQTERLLLELVSFQPGGK
jgi:hypothetical protein